MKQSKKFQIKAKLFTWRFVSKQKSESRTPQECLSDQDKKYFTEALEEGMEPFKYIFYIDKWTSVEAMKNNIDPLKSLKALNTSIKKNFPDHKS